MIFQSVNPPKHVVWIHIFQEVLMAWFWSISLSFVLLLISRVVAYRFADVLDWIASTSPSPHMRGSDHSSPSYEAPLVSSSHLQALLGTAIAAALAVFTEANSLL